MKTYDKHVVIFGSARSGTSWFSELIAQQYRYRMLFEPEHEFNTPKGKLICDKFITENNYSASAENYLKKVFANRIDNDWIAQISNRKWKRHLWPFIPKKYVIKMVRANLSANFIYNHFEIPAIKIIRNPYKTLLSQQRVQFPWLYDLGHFENQKELSGVLKTNFDFTFDSLKNYNDLEKLTLRWCIENCAAFQPKPSSKVPMEVVKHEELTADIDCFYRICDRFNLEPHQNLKQIYNRPSSKTHPRSKIRDKKNEQRSFTPVEYNQINAILDQFEISLYPRQNNK